MGMYNLDLNMNKIFLMVSIVVYCLFCKRSLSLKNLLGIGLPDILILFVGEKEGRRKKKKNDKRKTKKKKREC